MNKNSKKYIIIVSLLIVLYNVLVWVIPFPKQSIATFIISYIASMIAIIAQPLIYYASIHNKETLKSKLYGFPILKVGYIYFTIQLVLTVLFYILGCFLKIPTWISIVVMVIVLVLAVVGLLITDTYRDEIEKIEETTKINKKFLTELKINSEILVKKLEGNQLYEELKKFNELVKYSDPVSNPSLIECEDEIMNKFTDLKKLINENKIEEAQLQIKELNILMEERNKKCKLMK